ncbi:MAG: cupin [Pseudonocardiaceae bacterium]|nr:cupin [Pseudonocardiaceae bacterium]
MAARTAEPTAARTAEPTAVPTTEPTAAPAEVTTTATGAGRFVADRPAPAAPWSALARCVTADPDTFAEHHWGQRPLLSRRGDLPERFDDLLDLDAVDELLSRRGLRTPFLRIARTGEVVDSRQFTGPGGAGAEVADQVRDDQVAALFGEGATIVLQGLHRMWPPVIDFVTRLAEELGHPAQANAYVTPPSSRGFAAHYDVHDVFVLQLAGRKHWTVHPPVHQDPLRDQPSSRYSSQVAAAAEREWPLIDTVLEPGDSLYLPRGYLHAATALGEVSAHLTVGIHTVTRYALVEALAVLLADEPELRRSLPPGIDVSDPEQLAPQLRTVLDVLAGRLHRVPATDVARQVRERVWTGGRPEPLPPVAQATLADELRPGDEVRRRVGLGHRLHPGGEQLELELPDRTLTLPAGTAAALDVLLDGHPVAVDELPGLDESEQLVLVRRLLREGVLVAGAAGRR